MAGFGKPGHILLIINLMCVLFKCILSVNITRNLKTSKNYERENVQMFVWMLFKILLYVTMLMYLLHIIYNALYCGCVVVGV